MTIVVALVVLIAFLVVLHGPDATPANAAMNSVLVFMGEKRFTYMPFNEKEPYLQRLPTDPGEIRNLLKNTELSDEEQARILKAILLTQMLDRAVHYFSLQPGQQRTDYLDQLINQQGAGDSAATNGLGPALSQIENTDPDNLNPERRTILAEFDHVVRERRVALGLPTPDAPPTVQPPPPSAIPNP